MEPTQTEHMSTEDQLRADLRESEESLRAAVEALRVYRQQMESAHQEMNAHVSFAEITALRATTRAARGEERGRRETEERMNMQLAKLQQRFESAKENIQQLHKDLKAWKELAQQRAEELEKAQARITELQNLKNLSSRLEAALLRLE